MATFLESPRFPDNIAFGATVGPTYQTVVTPIYSGRDGRIVAWTQSRVRFEVGRRSMNAADTATLDAFFRAVKGRAYGFRIKDWTDFTDNGQGVLTSTATPGVYQLGKLYVTGALSENRMIQKPVAGMTTAYRNGAPVASITDSTTGLCTLTPFGSAAITGVTVGATTVVTLASAIAGLVVGGVLSISGLTGAGAAALNGQSFTVNSIAGSAYTLAVNTTGQTITTHTGNLGAMYGQPGDALTWVGQFDVPARFDIDEMKKQIMDRNGSYGDLLVDWGSIPILEVRV